VHGIFLLNFGEITADEFSMSADADTRGNGYVTDKLRMMMMMAGTPVG